MQWASWLRDVYGLITAAGNPLAEDQVQPLLLALQQRYAASVGEPAVPDRRNLLLSYELHAFATRHPEVRAVLRSWREASRDSLARHFDPLTARALDALVEGFSIHNSVDLRPTDREEVAAVVRAVVDRHQ
jgi:DNA-binding transcriptional regulator YbjK